MVGACGGVATTVSVGVAALRKGLTDSTGLVTALPMFQSLPLIDWDDVVVGGHEIRQTDLLTEAVKLSRDSRVIDRETIIACEDDLASFQKNIRPGVLYRCGATIEKLADRDDSRRTTDQSARACIDQISADLQQFAEVNSLDRVVVVNVASTEPAPDLSQLPETWAAVAETLERPDCVLTSSSLCAIAAIENGFPFVNFTPSGGGDLAAIEQLAIERKVCQAGKDGKTGETFLKSVLAPAFKQRNLEIMSWVGHNIFGNMDGRVLDDPINKETKVTSKDRLLGQILGYDPQTHISIEYIKSLGDWKTAWDHIHFRGFLGTPMIMTFTWQGCDSILAAPLVLDLARFTELAARKGEKGLLTFLSSFFKSPLGTNENDFAKQFELLTDWADKNAG
jgi:myo-inositol-1-phosphate synthase